MVQALHLNSDQKRHEMVKKLLWQQPCAKWKLKNSVLTSFSTALKSAISGYKHHKYIATTKTSFHFFFITDYNGVQKRNN